jgi:hypothetical protein
MKSESILAGWLVDGSGAPARENVLLTIHLFMSGTEVHLAYRFFACASMFLLMAKFIPV